MKNADQKYADSSVVEGAVSTLAVLTGSSRDVERILVSSDCDRENPGIARILELGAAKGVEIRELSPEEFSEITAGSTHGGIAAVVGERKKLSLEELLSKKDGFFVMLCGIEDPYNFGDALRSLYAFGADGAVLTPRNWTSAASVTARSSAGASELMDMAVCDDEEQLFSLCEKFGIKIVCAVEKDAVSLHRSRLERPLLLVVGGEKRGISRAILDHASQRVRIGYGRNFNRSLSASAAAAVIGYEVVRQSRHEKWKGTGKK